MQALFDVLQNYLTTKAALNGKATNARTPDQNSILLILPQFFRSAIEKLGRQNEFKIEGSIGAGNMAGVPWVGIFNLKITETAQNGYYIVLLFAEDMSSCFLTLNQGVTAFEKEYSRKVALQKMKETGERALRYFTPDPSAILGPIDLQATGHLGEGYQRGAIESYYYDAAALPSPTVLEEHFLTLLKHYDALFSVAGISLQYLAPVTEAQFQQAALEKAAPSTSKKKAKYTESAGALPVPPKTGIGGSIGYQRNPAVAAEALEQANFKCEIAPTHKTFVSSAKSLPYVEAHHLVPISKQGNFGVSLDVMANVVALCPMCHKLLHHGRAFDKKRFLSQLFSERKARLSEKGIFLDEKTLLNYYSSDLLEEDA